MDSIQIVRRTFNFLHPERVAHSFYPSDMVWGGIHTNAPHNEWCRTSDLKWIRTDEWGNLWQKTSSTSRGYIIQGALKDILQAVTFPFPDFKNPSRYSLTRSAFSNTPDKWHTGVLTGSTFEIANSLLDHYMDCILEYPLQIKILHDRIDKLLQDEILGLKEAGANGIMIIEDLGDTFQIPMGPSLWRDEFKSRFEKLVSFAHELGLKVIMHPAQENILISDLVETGIDCLQLDSPCAYGLDALEVLRDKYHVTFWCPVDVHYALQSKDEMTIRSNVREMLDRLWKGEGGFIAGFFWDNRTLHLEPRWQQYACEEFLLYGKKIRNNLKK